MVDIMFLVGFLQLQKAISVTSRNSQSGSTVHAPVSIPFSSSLIYPSHLSLSLSSTSHLDNNSNSPFPQTDSPPRRLRTDITKLPVATAHDASCESCFALSPSIPIPMHHPDSVHRAYIPIHQPKTPPHSHSRPIPTTTLCHHRSMT